MRPLVLSLLAGVGLALVVPQAVAEDRAIVLEFDAPHGPTGLPPPPSPAPIVKPAPAAPAPVVERELRPPFPVLKSLDQPPAPEAPPLPSPTPGSSLKDCFDGSAVWGSADLLLWWVRRQPLPPLATTSPTPSLGPVVLGGGGVNDDGVLGGRFTTGAWFDDFHTAGVQVSYFFLGTHDTARSVVSDGSVPLFRPFFDVAQGRPAGLPVAVPGGVTAHASSEGFQGLNVLLRKNLFGAYEPDHPYTVRIDLTLGYSYLTLQEGLQVLSDLLPAGSQQVSLDLFRTRNEFNGGQLGLVAEVRAEALAAQVEAGLAMGATAQSVLVEGSTPGALLAQPNNFGIHHHDTFSVVPQVGLKLSWQVCPWLRLTASYNALLWTGAVRPGDQASLAINPVRPTPFHFKDSDLWVQGLGVGLEVCY
jgi:hypothetical protein